MTVDQLQKNLAEIEVAKAAAAKLKLGEAANNYGMGFFADGRCVGMTTPLGKAITKTFERLQTTILATIIDVLESQQRESSAALRVECKKIMAELD